ncbi:PQQ-binding-like beta-propeller repeat protein [Glaciihabitans sp. UYNi722]|uniref:PQQ-binding-like beta-propeller repeat protein n=1 Tax=Glaciihabitans sp. UYNi722 TaxID=3156344 RepID=UPI003398622B
MRITARQRTPARGGFRSVGALTAAALILLSAGCASTQHGQGDPAPASGKLDAPASAWPSALYDARHSSDTAAVGPQHGTVKWTAHLGGVLAAGPVIGVDGAIIAGSNNGVLHAVDPGTGTHLWSFNAHGNYGSDLSTSPAVLPDGTILWPGPHDTLYALNRRGTLLWKEHFKGQVLSPAAVSHGRVYVADMTGQVVALSLRGSHHRTLWSTSVGGTDYASPAVGQNGHIYTSDGLHLVAVQDLGDHARIVWRFPVKKMIEVSPAVGPDGTVVIGTNNDREYGIHPDGKKAWAFRIHDYTYSSAVVRATGDGAFADNSGRVRTFNATTGDVQRVIAPVAPQKEHVWTSVVIDRLGDTYWASTTGHLYGYDPHGRHLFTTPIDAAAWSYPALGADGTLYLGTTSGTLYAVHG